MELILKNVKKKDFPVLKSLAKSLGFEIVQEVEKPYNPEFVKEILDAEQSIKDGKGVRGPYEESLVGLKIADLTQPLEIVRIIHSFDPCIACAVHVMDTKGNELSSYKVDVNGASC